MEGPQKWRFQLVLSGYEQGSVGAFTRQSDYSLPLGYLKIVILRGSSPRVLTVFEYMIKEPACNLTVGPPFIAEIIVTVILRTFHGLHYTRSHLESHFYVPVTSAGQSLPLAVKNSGRAKGNIVLVHVIISQRLTILPPKDVEDKLVSAN